MKKKKTRHAISLETKIAILDLFAKGEGSTAIGRRFNLGESTVRSIKKNEATIRKSVISGTKLSAKLSSYSRDILLEKTEKALGIWIDELAQQKIPLNGNLIREKALQLYESIRQCEPSTSTSIPGKKFSASKGWLTGFLKRNALRGSPGAGIGSTMEAAANQFPDNLSKIIEEEGYSSDQVFNAVEVGLYWKKMPNRSCVSVEEETEYGHSESNDRVTLLLCSNASGDRMLKPLVINRSLRPSALNGKNLRQLPVHWMANQKPWVTPAVFKKWFYNCFLEEVEEYLKKKFLEFKVLLVLDDGPGHTKVEHPNVKVIFLPPNTTGLLQPLNQGIIATFKKYYIKETYKYILNKLETEALTVRDVWKQFSIFDCLIHVASACAEIQPTTLNACWKKVWPGCVRNNATLQTSALSDEIINLAHQIGEDGFVTFSPEDLNELLADDVLSDNDIIDLTLDVVVGPDGDNDSEDKPGPLTAKIIQEGLQICNRLENHFLLHDPNSERAFQLQRELQNCMAGYRELYKKLKKELPSQIMLTEYPFIKQEDITQNGNDCENSCPLPKISIVETVYTDDEGDSEPFPKWCRPPSESGSD